MFTGLRILHVANAFRLVISITIRFHGFQIRYRASTVRFLPLLSTNSTIAFRVAPDQVKFGTLMKTLRYLEPSLGVSELRDRIAGDRPVIEWKTSRNVVAEYLENLHSILNLCRELRSKGIAFQMEVLEERGYLSESELRDFVKFHESYQPPLSADTESLLAQLDRFDWTRRGEVRKGESAIMLSTCDDITTAQRNWMYVRVGLMGKSDSELVSKNLHYGCAQALQASILPRIRMMTDRQLKDLRCVRIEKDSLAEAVCGLIAMACVETHFAAFLSAAVAVQWTTWLENGFVPCGWIGDYPEGQVVLTARGIE